MRHVQTKREREREYKLKISEFFGKTLYKDGLALLTQDVRLG